MNKQEDRSPSKISPHNSPNGSVQGEEIHSHIVKLQRELRTKDTKLEELLNEKKGLTKITKHQEVGILQLSKELQEAKETILKLRYDVNLKSQAEKDLFSEKKQQFEEAVEIQNSIKQLSQSNNKNGTKNQGPPSKDTSADLYYHVMKLENEVADRDRVIDELKSENKTLNKMIKQREDEFTTLQQSQMSRSDQIAFRQQIVSLENEIKHLQDVIQDSSKENEMLLTLHKAKTSAIEQLTEELSVRGATDDYVETLRREIKTKETINQQLQSENSQVYLL
jgi:DNA repair exonuclease SbcCD ATPase subunit